MQFSTYLLGDLTDCKLESINPQMRMISDSLAAAQAANWLQMQPRAVRKLARYGVHFSWRLRTPPLWWFWWCCDVSLKDLDLNIAVLDLQTPLHIHLPWCHIVNSDKRNKLRKNCIDLYIQFAWDDSRQPCLPTWPNWASFCATGSGMRGCEE